MTNLAAIVKLSQKRADAWSNKPQQQLKYIESDDLKQSKKPSELERSHQDLSFDTTFKLATN